MKYRVCLVTDRLYEAFVTVEAESEEEAVKAAVEASKDDPDVLWEPTEAWGGVEVAEVVEESS